METVFKSQVAAQRSGSESQPVVHIACRDPTQVRCRQTGLAGQTGCDPYIRTELASGFLGGHEGMQSVVFQELARFLSRGCWQDGCIIVIIIFSTHFGTTRAGPTSSGIVRTSTAEVLHQQRVKPHASHHVRGLANCSTERSRHKQRKKHTALRRDVGDIPEQRAKGGIGPLPRSTAETSGGGTHPQGKNGGAKTTCELIRGKRIYDPAPTLPSKPQMSNTSTELLAKEKGRTDGRDPHTLDAKKIFRTTPSKTSAGRQPKRTHKTHIRQSRETHKH